MAALTCCLEADLRLLSREGTPNPHTVEDKDQSSGGHGSRPCEANTREQRATLSNLQMGALESLVE